MRPLRLLPYAIGLLVLLFWGISGTDLAHIRTTVDSEGEVPPKVSSLLEPPRLAGSGVDGPRAVDQSDRVALGPGSVEGPSTFQGTAFVQRALHAPLRAIVDGSVVLGDSEVQFSVPIVDGIWSFASTHAADGEVEVLELGELGKQLRLFPDSHLSGGDQEQLVAFAYPGLFVVLLGIDGTPASEITVLRKPHGLKNSTEGSRRHPGNPGTLAHVRPYQTPAWIYLPSLPLRASGYWVNTPGAEWNLISAERTRREDLLRIDFEPGCSLQIAVKGFSATRGLGLHILQAGRAVARYDSMDRESVRLSGLPAGETVIMLSFDSLARESTAIARSEPVQLSPAALSVVSLTMPNLPGQAQQGEVKGVLTVEDPWLWSDLKDFERLSVVLSQDPPTPGFLALPSSTKWLTVSRMNKLIDTADAVAWEWSLSGLPAGTYTIRPSPIGSAQQVVVTAGQTTPVNLSIAPVARTLIDVLHEGQHCPDALIFNSSATRPSGAVLSVELFKEPGSSSYTLVCLPGEVSLFVVVPGLAPASKSFTAHPGWNNIQVDMPVALGFELVAVDSRGERVAFENWFDLEVNAVDGPGALVSRFVDHSTEHDSGVVLDSGVFFVSESGEYELSWPSASAARTDLPYVIRVEESPQRQIHQITVLVPDL